MEQGYDASGDVTNDGINQYLYDAEGRICAVYSEPVLGVSSMTGYLYDWAPVDRSSSTGRDADGTRVAKGTITNWSGGCNPALNGFQSTNDYILGLGGEQVTEMGINPVASAACPVANAPCWQHTNIWAGGKLLGTYDKDWLHFYLDDPLGTRRAQTDAAGVLEQTCSSLPFGDGLACSEGDLLAPTENHFTGKERDVESGNDYFEARYYNSAVGRFMSPDWSAKEEPVPYAKLDDPQTLNLYAYVSNNPMTREDSDGHECDTCQRVWNTVTFSGWWKSDAELQQSNKTTSTSSSGQSINQPKVQKLRDVTPEEGKKILKSAEEWEGAPYKYAGGTQLGTDCIHMVCAALNRVGINAVTRANANGFDKDVHLRPLGSKEKPRTGDIIQWVHEPTGHVGIYDDSPTMSGYNAYSATNHGVKHTPSSYFDSLGTPKYYRVQVPK